jgi:hypothetical protein
MDERLGNRSKDLIRMHRYSSALPLVFGIFSLRSAVCELIQEEGP